ncbi:MAG TPA: tetratricopeptide repeat protein [Blastocatellia bacterium]|nr:tetratricopeptide repeat protein [Blastocatellia bacterium]
MSKARANSINSGVSDSAAPGEVRPFSLLPLSGAVEFKSGHDESKHVTQSTSLQATPPGLVCPAITVIDTHRAIISPAQNSLSFFISSSIHSDLLASRIIQLADVAYNLRQSTSLKLLSQELRSVRGYEFVAAYYQGLAVENQGRGDLDRAKVLFEQAAEFAPTRFRARAILSLGAVEGYKGRVEKEAEFYSRALALDGTDYYTRIETARAIALLHSLDGDHTRSIEQLERLYPLARRFRNFNLRLYFDVLNSLAVEYAATGNIDEARRAIAPVIQSPLFDSIPEYRETAREIQQTERKKIIVTVHRLKKAILTFRLCFIAKRLIFSTVKPRVWSLTRTITERVLICSPTHAPPFNWKHAA